MPKAPDVIMREVIQNEHVFEIWQQLLNGQDPVICNDPYYKIFYKVVKAQYDACINRRFNPQVEGYQIGSPWHGDLGNGRIMFLSSNPAITPGCYYPRYHGNGRYTWYGDRVIAGNPYLNKNQDEYPVNNPDAACNLNAAIDFLRDRFGNTPLNSKNFNNPSWSVYMLNDENQVSVKEDSVDFWNNLWKTAVDLQGNANLQTTQDIRDVMENVVSAEIVPFVSMGEAGVKEAIHYCWHEYTRHVVAQYQGDVIFLVGDKTKTLFCKLVDDPAIRDAINRKQLVDVQIAGVNKKVAHLRHFSNGWSPKLHLPSKWFEQRVFEAIQRFI